MGNAGISRGTGNKGKSPSHLQISFPTKKLPSALPHQGLATSYSRVPIYTCSVCTIPLLHERPDQKYEILNIFNLHDTDRFTRAERKITHQIRGVLLFFLGGRVADALRVCKR